MKLYRITAIAAFASNIFIGLANAAGVTPTPLPADVQTDAAAVQAACRQLQSDHLRFRINMTEVNASAVAGSQATIRTDRANLRSAQQTLHTHAQSYFSADRSALSAAHAQLQDAFVQLKADATTNHRGNFSADQNKITTDYAALQSAKAQFSADRQQLIAAGGGGQGFGHGRFGREQGRSWQQGYGFVGG